MSLIVTTEELWRKYDKVVDIFELSDNALGQHVVTMILGTVFFAILQVIIHFVLETVKPRFYVEYYERNESAHKYQVSLFLMQCAHHFLQCFVALVNILYICDIPFGAFMCYEECLFAYRPYTSHAIAIAIGYFILDGVELWLFFWEKSATNIQLLVHHFMSSGLFILCLYGGMHMPALSQTVMLCELSSVHLIVRDLLGRKSSGSLATTNSIMLFISFTLFRILYFPIQINGHFNTAKYYDLFKMPYVHIIAWIISPIVFFLVFMLNCWWYQFLLKGLYKMIYPQKAKEDANDKDNEYKKVEDDA